MKKWLLLFTAILLLSWVGWVVWNQNQASRLHERARGLLEKGEPESARVYAEKALSYRPQDARLLLTFAESVYLDTTLDSGTRLNECLETLGRIADESALGYEARLREASILFFDRLMPVAAEKRLDHAIEIAPDRSQAYESLFQIYCSTGRETFVEPLFLKWVDAIENGDLAEDEQQAAWEAVLSSWFLSQFSLGTFNQRTDKQLGVATLVHAEIPTAQKRLLLFRDAEPDTNLARIALAYWFLLRNDGKQAKTLLDQMDVDRINPSDPLYLMTAVNTYLEVGEIELAKELHKFWQTEDYFEYWRQKGVLRQDYAQNLPGAIEAFQRGQQIWPGQIDPSVYFRLETCFQKLGKSDEAAKANKEGQEILATAGIDRIRGLQQLIFQVDFSPATCEQFIQFYKSLGREKELEYWTRLKGLAK